VTKAKDNTVSDNKYQGTEAHLVTIEFTPANEDYFNKVTANTQAQVGDKKLAQYTITYDLPEGMTLKMTNGGEALASGDKVYEGTKVTFVLTYPKGYRDVSLIKNESNPTEVKNPTVGENTLTYSDIEITSNLSLKVNYSGKISKTDIKLKIIEQGERYTELDYDGEVHNLTANNFEFSSPTDQDDIEKIKEKMVITYKLNGKEVVSPTNAGDYTVHVSIPEVEGENTTYNALEKDFEKGLVINKSDNYEVTFPKNAVVGVGKTAKNAQFIDGFAGVEGTFHFIEEDKIGVRRQATHIR
jgi:hypothetical protein